MNDSSKKQQTLNIMRKLKGHGIDIAANRKSIVEQEFGAEEESEENTPDSNVPETSGNVPPDPESEGEKKYSKRALSWLKSQYKKG